MKIAFLACPATLPGSPTRRPDAFEHDLYLGAVRDGLGARGTITDIDWRAPLADLAQFDLALLGTPWDYTEAKDEFLARLGELAAAGVTVCNPLEVVRWNADKLYLQELGTRGAVTIPTLWPERAGPDDVLAAFDHFGTDRVVVKRRVGAGAVGQDSFSRVALPAADWSVEQAAMIQPFLPAIQTEGELSFIFIDGTLCHALIKRAKAGDYRIQSLYGGSEEPIEPAPADRADNARGGDPVLVGMARRSRSDARRAGTDFTLLHQGGGVRVRQRLSHCAVSLQRRGEGVWLAR